MKLLQGRKILYDGTTMKDQSSSGMLFTLHDHIFKLGDILSGKRYFTQLELKLPNLDFLQIIAASGFKTVENSIFGKTLRKGFPADRFDAKESYWSPDGLTLTYEFRDNLLYVFSFGEKQPGHCLLYSEGVWELYAITAVSLFKDISGELDDLNLKELVNHQDYNISVFNAVYNILKPQQKAQFDTFNNSDAASEYRKMRNASVPFVDFHHLPEILNDDTIRKILEYRQEFGERSREFAPLRYMLWDLLSQKHRAQITRYEGKISAQERAAKLASMTEAEKQEEKERHERTRLEGHKFQGNMGEPDTVENFIEVYGFDPRVGRTLAMDLQELHDKLIETGCYRFYIEGISKPQTSDENVLKFSNGVWSIYYSKEAKIPFYTSTDKDAALKFYYDYVKKIEHRHLVVFTRSITLLNEYKSRLEREDIRTIENGIPDYQLNGDIVYRLFVANSLIFPVRKIFPVVPYYDFEFRSNPGNDHTLTDVTKETENIIFSKIPSTPDNSETPTPKGISINIKGPQRKTENIESFTSALSPDDANSENLTFVPFHDDDYFPEIKSHNQKVFGKQCRKLVKITVLCLLIGTLLQRFHIGLSALFFVFAILLIVWMIIFRYKQDFSKAAFKVRSDGVFINQQFLRNAFVPWSNIAKVEQRGFTVTPAIVITFKDIKTLLKDQFFVLRSLAKAQLNPKPTIVISQFETEGDLNRTFEIIQNIINPKLQKLFPDPQKISSYYNSQIPVSKPEAGYIRLENNKTKTYFREIVAAALQQAEIDYDRHPEFPFHESFYNQLKDIQKTVIDENVVYTEAEAYKKYPMAVMAARNFEDDPRIYIRQISDIVSGISQYPEMPEILKTARLELTPEEELLHIKSAFAYFFAEHDFKFKSSGIEKIVYENEYSQLIFNFDGYGLRFGYMSPAEVYYKNKVNDRVYSIKEIMYKVFGLDFKLIFAEYFDIKRLEYYESLKEIIQRYLNDIFSDAAFSWAEIHKKENLK